MSNLYSSVMYLFLILSYFSGISVPLFLLNYINSLYIRNNLLPEIYTSLHYRNTQVCKHMSDTYVYKTFLLSFLLTLFLVCIIIYFHVVKAVHFLFAASK